jgi:isoleucyl-tRNA synthetase
MDIIRLWVGSSDYSDDIRYSDTIMAASADQYRTLRNTLRWLLGNLPAQGVAVPDVNIEHLPELERYVLAKLHEVLAEARGQFEAHQFHAGVRALMGFCTTTLSNLYFDVRKDCLYCDAEKSATRQACVWVLEHIFRGLVTHFAPIVPFTTDEAWRCRYGENTCVHLEVYHKGVKVAEEKTDWLTLLALRDEANKAIEGLRTAGTVGASAEVALTYVQAFAPELVQLVCGVSEATPGSELKVTKHPGHKCPRCWRYYAALETDGLCTRCNGAVAHD